MPPTVFTQQNLPALIHDFCQAHPLFLPIYHTYGSPPFWHRPNEFATLVKIILEQQVHLHSAAASYQKLLAGLQTITPETLMNTSVQQYKEMQVSRQKASYLHSLAQCVHSKKLHLAALETADEPTIGQALRQVKGIGVWTVQVYLLMVLHRMDVWPSGDVTLYRTLVENEMVNPQLSRPETDLFMQQFSPQRSMATLLLYHAYLRRRNREFTTI